jgi:hypothetical protein
MFQKVHDSSVLGMDEDMRKQIQDLLQRTRSRNFLRTLPADLRLYDEALVQIGFGPRTTDAARQQTLNDGLEHFQTDNTDADVLDAQLINLVPRCGYVTLSVCLHSRTFLDYIRTGNDTYDLDAAHEDDDTDLSDEPLPVKKLECCVDALRCITYETVLSYLPKFATSISCHQFATTKTSTESCSPRCSKLATCQRTTTFMASRNPKVRERPMRSDLGRLRVMLLAAKVRATHADQPQL